MGCRFPVHRQSNGGESEVSMAVREYVGARYVPLFSDPLQWSNTQTYEPLTIVLNQGNSYTSRQFVPTGIDISNEDYWALTGNYNAQIEQYRQEVKQLGEDVDNLQTEVGYLDNFNVPEQFGAKGDGVTDDTNAMTQWLASGESLAMKPGKTYLCSAFTIPTTVKSLNGFNATIKMKPNQSGFCITMEAMNCDMHDFILDCNGNAQGFSAQATRCTVSRARIINFTGTGLQAIAGTASSGYEAVFNTIYLVAQNTAQYGVYVRRADCIFDNIVTQDCLTAFRFDQGSTLLTNIHSWIRTAAKTFSGTNMFHVTTPDVIVANNVYCDTIEALVMVPTSVTPTANISVKNAIMLVPEGYTQFLCRTYSGATNTYGVSIEYGFFPGRVPRTYNVATFLGRAECINRINAGSELLAATSTSMRNVVSWGFQTGVGNTPNTGLSIYYQLLNIGYAGVFDLTTTAEKTPESGYVTIGAMPPMVSTNTGIKTVGLCSVGGENTPIAIDFDNKLVKIPASANIPNGTRIMGSVFFPMYMG